MFIGNFLQVRAIENRFSPSRRLNDIVTADGFKRAATENEVAEPVKVEEQADTIHQNDG